MYRVVYLDHVIKDLKRFDRPIIKKIITRIEKYLAKDPKTLGKALKGDFQGYWRYRFADYRVIYRISESEILITVLRVGHRKDVYKGKMDE